MDGVKQDIFVFVVCGSNEHIDTLHFSLDRLLKYTRNRVIVLTDSTRNETPIKHSDIIDVKTDPSFNNHQASIYLKTGLYQFLPKGNTYCYLDTDVVALDSKVDDIFKEYASPITFAPDHCQLKKFSPYASTCSCLTEWEKSRAKFNDSLQKHDPNQSLDQNEISTELKALKKEFAQIKNSVLLKLKQGIRYVLSCRKFTLNDDFYFDKKERVWRLIKNNQNILFEVDVRAIEKETGFKYSAWDQRWLDEKGKDIWKDECDHLKDNIAQTFDVAIEEENWQHWNGGVFLFNDQSHKFLSAWHEKSVGIFNNPDWKTRDQGTLIATVWEFGLQNHQTLSKQWNFIADYYKEGLDFNKEGEYTDNYWKHRYKVSFIHVYHHWGDDSWPLWQNLTNAKN